MMLKDKKLPKRNAEEHDTRYKGNQAEERLTKHINEGQLDTGDRQQGGTGNESKCKYDKIQQDTEKNNNKDKE